MEDIQDELVVAAPTAAVWDAIRDPAKHARWHPAVTRIDGDHALGAVRECEVMVGKKPGRTAERCTVFDEGRRIMWTVEKDSTGFSRMVSDWSAGFSLEPYGDEATRVVARSVFLPRTLPTRLMLPVIRRKFHQAQRGILAGLKQHLES